MLSGWKDSFFLQDGTAGISVDRAEHGLKLTPGLRVTVHGVTDAGSFAPIVRATAIEVLGQGRMPFAPLRTSADLKWGAQDSQYLAVRGVIRSAEVKPTWGRETTDAVHGHRRR